MTSKRLLHFIVAGLLCYVPRCGLADSLEVNTEWLAHNGSVQVQVAFSIPLTPAEVMDVLTDYEHMHQFVPDIQSTKLVYAEKNHKVIELKGVADFLFIEFPIEVVMDVVFSSNGLVTLRSISGNLTVQGEVKISQAGSKTNVTYNARLRPNFWLPPVIGPALIGRQIKRQFVGQIAEMYRRHSNDSLQASLGI